jgi:hypothetical protein
MSIFQEECNTYAGDEGKLKEENCKGGYYNRTSKENKMTI